MSVPSTGIDQRLLESFSGWHGFETPNTRRDADVRADRRVGRKMPAHAAV